MYYFAYGSNLHPVRLIERVASAKLMGVVQLNQYQLLFHKKSQDGSGKCNLLNTGSSEDSVYGAIYDIDEERKLILDDIEGRCMGYVDKDLSLELNGKKYSCFTYIAEESYIIDDRKPYDWYRELVLSGGNYLNFPDTYINYIESIEFVVDIDPIRRKKNDILLQKIREFNQTNPFIA